MARLMVRCREVLQSAAYIDRLLDAWERQTPPGRPAARLHGAAGPRGAVVRTGRRMARRDMPRRGDRRRGRIAACRIKDPSLHNWLALALAVRGEGISDFPICNKSFNLSYCGHDL